MNAGQQYVKWVEWLNIIKAEITRLAIHRHVFWEVSKIIRANSNIHKPNVFYSWVKNAYITDITIGIRRQLDTDERVVSLANLLRGLIKYPQVMSRERFVLMYQGSTVEQLADRDFDRFAGAGKPYIDAAQVKADLVRLENLWKVVKKYINRRIAHIDVRGIKYLPSFNDLDDCQDLLEELLKKYLRLFRGSSSATVLPTILDDWQEIFREPWIVGEISETLPR